MGSMTNPRTVNEHWADTQQNKRNTESESIEVEKASGAGDDLPAVKGPFASELSPRLESLLNIQFPAHEGICQNLTVTGAGIWAALRDSLEAVWEAWNTPAGLQGNVWLLQEVEPQDRFPETGISRPILLDAWWDLLHPDDVEPTRQALDRAFQTGEDFRAEYRLLRGDGTIDWLKSWGIVEESDADDSAVMVGTARNITRLRQVEEELNQARRELRHNEPIEMESIGSIRALNTDREWIDIVGKSGALAAVLEQVRQVSVTNSVVLITGETGTGKDLIARAIHAGSRRRDRPLITVNCAALPPTLIESELFGHEKGAFTGAVSRRTGRFEMADRGTIFLDEIGELPADLQAKLLRVLQTREFERVGSCETRRVDVRVIAATNSDLADAVQKGTFRSDLFFRLNVFPIKMPALRERREDIPLLVSYLVEKKGQEMRRPVEHIPSGVIERLCGYDWPGNVRELENVVERSLILSKGPALSLDGAFGSVATGDALAAVQPAARGAASGTPLRTLREVEREEILRVCEESHWKIKGRGAAAARLGLNPSTLYFRLKKLGITRPPQTRF
jgi:transcriptional regulator with PAS, ATPase and Fis domain